MSELIVSGDSWSFGSEIVDPSFKNKDIIDWDACNDEYRTSNIWPNILSNELKFDRLKNLSFPAISNDRITRSLVNYITKYYLYEDKPTDDIFVIVGLSSPERKEFFYKDNQGTWVTLWPAWEHNYSEHVGMSDFAKSYICYFNNVEEYLNRYVNQIYYLQNFFKANNIKYLIFQSFYQPTEFHNKINEWNDTPYITEWNTSFHGSGDTIDSKYYMGSSEPEIWKLIDSTRFMNKNEKNHSFHGYLLEQQIKDNNSYFVGLHPNEKGHKIWSDKLTNYIVKNNLYRKQ